MPSWLLRAAAALAFVLGASFAWAPLAATPLLAGDFHALVDARALLDALRSSAPAEALVPRLFGVHGTVGHPLPALSLALSDLLWARAGSWRGSAVAMLRLEHVALLLGAAALLAAFVRRLLVPWTGRGQATAAAWSAAVLFALYPLQPAVVVALDARGQLLALALGLASGALLLKSRQERQPPLAVGAGLLAILAGLASGVAWALPPVLAAAEFASARRYRPVRVRLRTAATTLAVFAACVGVDPLLRAVQRRAFEAAAAPLAAVGPSGWREALELGVERFGVLVLPVNAAALGAAGFALAGALLLIAVQPALLAARSAPRMWGWLLASWIALLLLFELLQPRVRIGPEDLSHAAALFPAAAALCAGLAVAATSVSGARRAVLPALIALGFTVLAHAEARARQRAGLELARLRADLEATRETYGRDARLLVVEPPRLVRGVDPTAGALPWMLSGLFGPRADVEPPHVHGLSLPAFLALAREPELGALRSVQLVAVLPRALLGEPHGGRVAVRVPPPQPSSGPRSWFRKGISPALDLEPWTSTVLRVRASEGADTTVAPRVRWRAASPAAGEGEHAGVWLSKDEAPTALFDLGASPAWLLGERILQVRPGAGWSVIGSAEVREALPPPAAGLLPRVEGADWLFDAPAAGLPELQGGAETWAVELLDLASLAHVELSAVREGQDLRARGAAGRVAQLLLGGGGPVAWTLEQRLDGVAVARTGGRRVERRDQAGAGSQ